MSLFALAASRLRRCLRGGGLPAGARSRLRAVWVGPLIFGLLSGTAHAQAYQCRAPQGPLAIPDIAPDGPERRMAISGYTLALSWSPEFCRQRSTQGAHRQQCSGAGGRFGFVVHGLWPEGAAGRWPQWCAARRKLSANTARAHLCMMPSTRLMAHEWAKHGSCMVRTPESYLKVTAILWNSLHLPDLDRLSRQDGLTAGTIRQAFAEANGRHWTPAMVGIDTSRNGWLEELRLCYGRDFMPKACERRRIGPPDAAPLNIWRGL